MGRWRGVRAPAHRDSVGIGTGYYVVASPINGCSRDVRANAIPHLLLQLEERLNGRNVEKSDKRDVIGVR